MSRYSSPKLLASVIAVISMFMTTVSVFGQGPHGADQPTGDWRLPFTGSLTISNGPGEGLHTNSSSEAIDYGGQFTVAAVADGNILDVLYVNDFGWVVRVAHSDLYTADPVVSFYAHMLGTSVNNWTIAATVRQGDTIGTSSNSGTAGMNAHLHLEARTGTTQGNVYSGQSVPIRSIPGQWWNQWYSPVPNFQHDPAQASGNAQYPATYIPPTAGQRHIASFDSPYYIPAVYLSNISGVSVWFNMAGSPSTPNTNWATSFQNQEYVNGVGWQCPNGCNTSQPVYYRAVNSSNQCLPSGQHCHIVWSNNVQRGWSDYRTVYFHTGNIVTRQPHFVASYNRNADIAVLTYDSPSATWFTVWEDTPAPAAPTNIYYGPAKSIRVKHQSNRNYLVSAWNAQNGWSPWSIWLVP